MLVATLRRILNKGLKKPAGQLKGTTIALNITHYDEFKLQSNQVVKGLKRRTWMLIPGKRWQAERSNTCILSTSSLSSGGGLAESVTSSCRQSVSAEVDDKRVSLTICADLIDNLASDDEKVQLLFGPMGVSELGGRRDEWEGVSAGRLEMRNGKRKGQIKESVPVRSLPATDVSTEIECAVFGNRRRRWEIEWVRVQELLGGEFVSAEFRGRKGEGQGQWERKWTQNDGEVVHKTKGERKKVGHSACENILNSQRLDSRSDRYTWSCCCAQQSPGHDAQPSSPGVSSAKEEAAEKETMKLRAQLFKQERCTALPFRVTHNKRAKKSFARQGRDRGRERRGVAGVKRERDTHLERRRMCSARRRTPVGGASTAMRLHTARLRPTRNGDLFAMLAVIPTLFLVSEKFLRYLWRVNVSAEESRSAVYKTYAPFLVNLVFRRWLGFWVQRTVKKPSTRSHNARTTASTHRKTPGHMEWYKDS
ncbi:hypothetical protein C8R44DRAFT_742520 [Mycena epipterygia]|nr:hypothetical protein C8R44DRAFT_742520 [Mycena epipterygia]